MINYDSLPLVLSVKDVAEILNVGINTAYRLLRKKVIPSIRVGRQYRVSRTVFIAYLEDSRMLRQ